MAANISVLNIALNATVAPLISGLNAGSSAISSFVDKIAGVGGSLLSLTGIAGLVGSALGAVFSISSGFKTAAELETANVQLTALTGNAQVAGVMLGQLRDFAASSPFAFPELQEASKRLIAVGVNASSVVPLLHVIGDVAAGVGAPIGDIADMFTRVAAEGKLGSRELREFARQGIPLTQVLAAQLHTTAAGVAEMAEAGQIGIAQLTTAFQAMTGTGGRFAGILQAQAGTIGGIFHSLSATVTDTLGDVAETIISGLNLRPALASIGTGFATLRPQIVGWVAGVLPSVKAFGVEVYETFASLYQRIEPYLSGVWTLARVVFAGITSIAEVGGAGLLNVYVGYWNDIKSFVAPIVSSIVDVVSTHWRSIIATTVEFATGVISQVSGAFTGLVQIASTLFNALTDVFNYGWSLITGKSVEGSTGTTTAFTTIGAGVGWLAEHLAIGFNVMGYVFGHFTDVVSAAGTTVIASFVQLGNFIAYEFTDVIPTYINWFVLNAINAFVDFGNNSVTLFENMAKNIGNVMSNLPGLIAGTTDLSTIWKPLSDGFQLTYSALPGIAARQKGALENALDDQAKSMRDKVSDGLSSYLDKKKKDAADSAKSITDSITDAMKPLSTSPEIAKPSIPQPDPLKLDVKTMLDPAAMTLAVTPEVKRAKIIRSGGAESLAARVATRRVIPFGGAADAPKAQPVPTRGLGVVASGPVARAGLSGAVASAIPPAAPTPAPGPPLVSYATGTPTGVVIPGMRPQAAPTVPALSPAFNLPAQVPAAMPTIRVPTPPTPTVPEVGPVVASTPGASTARAGVAEKGEAGRREDMRQANEWGRRIEFNTRPLQQNQNVTVSL